MAEKKHNGDPPEADAQDSPDSPAAGRGVMGLVTARELPRTPMGWAKLALQSATGAGDLARKAVQIAQRADLTARRAWAALTNLGNMTTDMNTVVVDHDQRLRGMCAALEDRFPGILEEIDAQIAAQQEADAHELAAAMAAAPGADSEAVVDQGLDNPDDGPLNVTDPRR